MRKEEAKWQKVLWIVFMLLFSITATAVAAYIYGNSLRDICLLLIVVTAVHEIETGCCKTEMS